jgi:polysaccharide biosynthesis transport protein
MDPSKASAPSPEAKLHFLDYWRIIRLRKTVVWAVFLLVVITTVVVTFILPQAYCGIARIKVEKDQTDIPGIMERQNFSGYDPYFIQTEYEIIQSQKILHKVIENLDLNRAWGQKYYGGGETLTTAQTYTILKRHIDLRPTRNTSLIVIRAYSENKEEAARIANEVATVYHDYRLELLKEQSMRGINTLKQTVEEHEKKLRKKQQEVDSLRTELKIAEWSDAGSPSPTLEKETLRRLEAQRIETEAQYVKEAEMLSRLKPLSREELKNVIPTAAPDPLLHSYLVDLGMAENKLAALKKDYGPDNPVYQSAAAVVDDLTQKVNARIDGAMVGLEARVDSLKTGVDKFKEEVASARKTDLETAANARPYHVAQLELEELQRFNYVLNQKIAMESVQMELPKTGMVEIVDRADPATMRPVRPNKPLNIALGIIVGLVVGIGLAFFIEYLDTSVKTIDDVERALQSPVLGVIPQNVGRLIDEGAESPHAEAYRVLRTNLLFSRKDDTLNSMAVVSAGAGEGKSTTVFNLATVFAQSGQRVLIVDSDLRRPSLHKFLRVANTIGLTNYLLGQNTLEEVIQTTSLATLDFMASGKLPSSSMGILSSSQMKTLITELKQRYDYVFFDSPPIMGVSDASILASEVDMTLQVIQYRRYPQPMNIRAKQTIEKVGGTLMGIVLNNINMSQDESYYYYGGYYHDYYSKNTDADEAAAEGAPAGKKTRLDIKRNS